jgi:hypothetical protein
MTGNGNAFARQFASEEGDADDSISIGRCGRWSRHQVFALLLHCSDGRRWLIPYGSLLPSDTGKIGDKRFQFQFALGERLLEVVVTGTAGGDFDMVLDKIAGGKMELLKPVGDPVKSIVVRDLDEVEEQPEVEEP